MARKLERRCEKYAVKLAAGIATRSRRVSVEEQYENYVAAHDRLEAVWETTREVLDSIGLPTIAYPYYRAFALQVDKLLRRYGSEAIDMEVGIVCQMWVARGLSQSTLETILREVFRFQPSLLASLVGRKEV